MDTRGAAPCQLGAGQGAAASAVALAGAKPGSSLGWPRSTGEVRGAHARSWGWKQREGSESTAWGDTVWNGNGQSLASFPDSELLLLGGLGQRAAALPTSNGLWVLCPACGKHKPLVPSQWLCQISLWQLVVALPAPQGCCGISTAHLCGPWAAESCRGQRECLSMTGANRAAGGVFPLSHSGDTDSGMPLQALKCGEHRGWLQTGHNQFGWGNELIASNNIKRTVEKLQLWAWNTTQTQNKP